MLIDLHATDVRENRTVVSSSKICFCTFFIARIGSDYIDIIGSVLSHLPYISTMQSLYM